MALFRGLFFTAWLVINAWSLVAGISACQATEFEPLQLEAKVSLGDVRGRIDHRAVNLARNRLFVSALGNDSLSVVNLEARRLERNIEGLRKPQGVGYDPGTEILYVANGDDGSVSLFKGAHLAPVGQIELGTDADNIRVDSKAGRIFIGHGDGALAIVDAATHDKIGSVPLKVHPESFQLDGNTNRVFVNVPNSGAIDVVDRTSGKKDCVLANGGPQRELRHGAGSRPPTGSRGFSRPGGAWRLLCGGRGIDIVHPDLRRRR